MHLHMKNGKGKKSKEHAEAAKLRNKKKNNYGHSSPSVCNFSETILPGTTLQKP